MMSFTHVPQPPPPKKEKKESPLARRSVRSSSYPLQPTRPSGTAPAGSRGRTFSCGKFGRRRKSRKKSHKKSHKKSRKGRKGRKSCKH